MAAPLPVNLHEYEPLAKAAMSAMAWDYLAGGSGDERTLAWNRERFEAIRLWPHVLRDVSRIDTRLTSRSTWGHNRIASNRSRFHASVRSSPLPPAR